MIECSTLGVVPALAENVLEEVTALRKIETRSPIEFEDWTIDGRR